MRLHFYKYHGTGNDFILIDARKNNRTELSSEQIKNLCHRRFGVGADGLMLLKAHAEYDFEMIYYNSDGGLGTMCGNGGRCITAFAKHLDIIKNDTKFIASDGIHEANIEANGLISLKMSDVEEIKVSNDHLFLNTGSPHYVKFVNNPNDINIVEEGKKIRYSKAFGTEGTNVNFVSKTKSGIFIRTYERGVEDETYSCGTGSVAASIAFYLQNTEFGTKIPIKTLGGMLEVSFSPDESAIRNIYLKGPAKLVYEGEIDV